MESERFKKWSNDEEKQLLNKLKLKTDINKIALEHKRTVGAIRARIGKLIYSMFLEKNSINEIMEKTNFTKNYIEKIIKRKQKYDIEYDNETENDIEYEIENNNQIEKIIKKEQNEIKNYTDYDNQIEDNSYLKNNIIKKRGRKSRRNYDEEIINIKLNICNINNNIQKILLLLENTEQKKINYEENDKENNKENNDINYIESDKENNDESYTESDKENDNNDKINNQKYYEIEVKGIEIKGITYILEDENVFIKTHNGQKGQLYGHYKDNKFTRIKKAINNVV